MIEREINMAKVFVNFLLNWRRIILFLIIGTVLGGVFGYIVSVNENKKQTEEVVWAKDELNKIDIMMADGQEVDTERIEDIQAIIERGVVVYPGISVKYIGLFAVFVLFGYAFCFIITQVLNDELSVTDELEELFAIAQLGLIVKEKKNTGLSNKIDNFILRLRDGKERKPTGVQSLQLAYVAVGLLAEKNESDTVYFVGCDIKGHTAYVCEQLKHALEKKDIHVEVLSNVLYNPEMMSKLECAQGVVLVEKVGVTKYKEIQREIELMERMNISVWGGIIVQ